MTVVVDKVKSSKRIYRDGESMFVADGHLFVERPDPRNPRDSTVVVAVHAPGSWQTAEVATEEA